MHRPTASLSVAILAFLVGGGCSDGVALATTSASASIGSASVATGEGTDTAESDAGEITDTAESDAGESTAPADTTADPDGSSTGDTSTGDTTGEPPHAGNSQSQLVNVGGRMSSPSFELIHTIGQPSQLQSSHASTHFRLQGGLVGANGNPP